MSNLGRVALALAFGCLLCAWPSRALSEDKDKKKEWPEVKIQRENRSKHGSELIMVLHPNGELRDIDFHPCDDSSLKELFKVRKEAKDVSIRLIVHEDKEITLSTILKTVER